MGHDTPLRLARRITELEAQNVHLRAEVTDLTATVGMLRARSAFYVHDQVPRSYFAQQQAANSYFDHYMAPTNVYVGQHGTFGVCTQQHTFLHEPPGAAHSQHALDQQRSYVVHDQQPPRLEHAQEHALLAPQQAPYGYGSSSDSLPPRDQPCVPLAQQHEPSCADSLPPHDQQHAPLSPQRARRYSALVPTRRRLATCGARRLAHR